jgi:hypothetical protein
MDNQIQLLRVVVASPGDVRAERDAVSSVVEEINRSIGTDRRVRLEVIRWETDTHPGFSSRRAAGTDRSTIAYRRLRSADRNFLEAIWYADEKRILGNRA